MNGKISVVDNISKTLKKFLPDALFRTFPPVFLKRYCKVCQ